MKWQHVHVRYPTAVLSWKPSAPATKGSMWKSYTTGHFLPTPILFGVVIFHLKKASLSRNISPTEIQFSNNAYLLPLDSVYPDKGKLKPFFIIICLRKSDLPTQEKHIHSQTSFCNLLLPVQFWTGSFAHCLPLNPKDIWWSIILCFLSWADQLPIQELFPHGLKQFHFF